MVNANKGTRESWLGRQNPAQMPTSVWSPNRPDIRLHVRLRTQDSAPEAETVSTNPATHESRESEPSTDVF